MDPGTKDMGIETQQFGQTSCRSRWNKILVPCEVDNWCRVHSAGDTAGFFLVEVFDSLLKLVWYFVCMKPRSTYEELAEAVQMLNMEQLRDAINKCKWDDKITQLI